MTEPAEKLWVTDEELVEQAAARGVPHKHMRAAISRLDADRLSGFPAKDPIYGNKRYWPSILEYWRVTHPVPSPRGHSTGLPAVTIRDRKTA